MGVLVCDIPTHPIRTKWFCVQPRDWSLGHGEGEVQLATDIYIEHVNGCPCRWTVIHLYRGANSSDLQEKRNDLTIILKGSKKKKEQLRKEKPDVYSLSVGKWRTQSWHSTITNSWPFTTMGKFPVQEINAQLFVQATSWSLKRHWSQMLLQCQCLRQLCSKTSTVLWKIERPYWWAGKKDCQAYVTTSG